MNKAILIFLSAFTLSFFSCKTETDTKYLELAAMSSDTGSGIENDKALAVKNASYVIHYKQKVLTNDQGNLYVTSASDGFEKAEAEDRSSSPVLFLTLLSTLAKKYDGFTYSYAIQKDDTIYMYYTRNIVEYSFYKDANTLGDKIRGVYGLTCTPPDVLIGNNVVTKWNSSPDGSGSAIPQEFGPVNASYYSNGTGIGTKHKPTTAGDIVFTDGTAATTEQVKAASDTLKENYKKYALAVIVFDHYNTYSGSPDDGKQLIGAGIKALRNTEFINCKWRNAQPDSYKTFECYSNHGYYDFEKLKQLYESNPDNLQTYWTAFYYASVYITKCFPEISSTDSLCNNWYLPSWKELGYALSGDLKYYKIIENACTTLSISLNELNNKAFWASPNQMINTGTDDAPIYTFFCAYITSGNDWKELTFEKDKPSSGEWANQWKIGENHTFNILPFRVFK